MKLALKVVTKILRGEKIDEVKKRVLEELNSMKREGGRGKDKRGERDGGSGRGVGRGGGGVERGGGVMDKIVGKDVESVIGGGGGVHSGGGGCNGGGRCGCNGGQGGSLMKAWRCPLSDEAVVYCRKMGLQLQLLEIKMMEEALENLANRCGLKSVQRR